MTQIQILKDRLQNIGNQSEKIKFLSTALTDVDLVAFDRIADDFATAGWILGTRVVHNVTRGFSLDIKNIKGYICISIWIINIPLN
jgi:hypothetical protein